MSAQFLGWVAVGFGALAAVAWTIDLITRWREGG